MDPLGDNGRLEKLLLKLGNAEIFCRPRITLVEVPANVLVPVHAGYVITLRYPPDPFIIGGDENSQQIRASGDIPEPDCLIVGAGDQGFAVPRDGDGPDFSGVADE